MKTKLLLLILTVGMQFSTLAQKKTPPVTLIPSLSYSKAQLDRIVPRGRPEDVSSPEAIVRALHDSVSGPQGSWNSDRLRSLCVPNVFFEYLDKGKDGTVGLSTVSMDKIANVFKELHRAGPWYERAGNLSVTRIGKDQLGMIAIVNYSAAEGTEKDKPMPYEPTATTTLLYLGNRWWVVSHTW
jgi:hypothetical protein